ncbi:MAG: heme ABC transporter permease CcmC [Magnetococcus sp. WYHC-3]
MKFLTRVQFPLGLAVLLGLGLGLYMTFSVPADFQQGNSVLIMFIHIPAAKMGLLMYVILTVAAAIHLWKRSELADIVAAAAAPVGAAFTAVTLLTGAIWGKPMWGAWWVWDARLTSMLVLLILYVGLITLRSALEDPFKASRATAVLAIIGFVDLPIIHFSVTWWRTQHNPAAIGKGGMSSIDPAFLQPLTVMALAFILLGLFMLILKMRQESALRRLEALEEVRHGNG